MKKFLSFLIAIMTLTTLVSCGSSDFSSLGSEGSPISGGLTDDSSDRVIAFNNAFISLANRYGNYVDGLPYYLETAEKILDGTSHFSENAYYPTYDNVHPMTALQIPDLPKMMSSLHDPYETYKATFTEIRNIVVEMDKYFSAEDYRDDAGAKGADLIAQIHAKAETFYQAQDAVYALLNPLADAAEAEILQDHPYRDQILSSKEVLRALGDFWDVLENNISADTYDDVVMQSAYDALDAALTRNKSTKPLSDATIQIYYARFQDSVDTFLGAARVMMRSAREEGSISKGRYNELDTDYSIVISSYNRFVD